MNPRNLYVIDSGVNDFQALIDKLPDGSEWILLDPARDGVLQLQEILLNYQGLDSLHILSHGASGALHLGTTALTNENLSRYADALHSIGAALSPGGDLLLYGCAVAEGVSGTIFVERLAQATGADVAASTNPTGAMALGGDWVLERHSGTVESIALAVVSSGGLLAANTAPTLSISTSPATASEIEYNDEKTFASTFTVAAIGGLSGLADVDWFAVRLEAPGTQTVSFDTSALNAGLWNVVWYGPGMQVLSNRIVGPSAGTATITYEIAAFSAGVYYVKVQPNDPNQFNSGLYNVCLGAFDQSTYTDTDADDTFTSKTGQLIGNDADAGTTLSYGISTGLDRGATMSLAGSFGSLTVTRTTGSFIYVPNDAAIEGLKGTAVETFTMTVSDGTATTSATYTLSLAGADDPTTFDGATTGIVSEDGTTTASGVLSVNDRDTGDAAISAQVDTAGAYGWFSIDTQGNWTYSLNNSAIKVQSLVAGQSATESFVIATAGGTTQDILVTVNGADDLLIGTSNAETLTGSLITDQIFGLAGNDTLIGLGDNDTLDGGPGIDTAWYTDIRAHFQFTRSVSGDWTVQDTQGDEGTDRLHDIERLQFADMKIALDLKPDENAGLALEFLGVLAPELISAPSVVGAILNRVDQGSGLQGLFQLALDLGLVSQIAGAGTNTAVAQMAFRNVIGAQPDAMTTDRLLSFMDGRIASFSQAEFLTAIASLEVNQDHIGLVGLQQTGIEYL
jgi:VCBS repeat-containing protein